MRAITDIFIRQPVLAIVVNLIIVLMGLRAIFSLPVQQYPQMENASILVTTVYVGATADTVRGFLTTPIERAVSSIAGVDYVQSSSVAGVSTVTVRLALNHDSTRALAEVTARLQQVRSELPAEAEPPQPAPDYKYVTLDKVIIMLRGRSGEAVSHYMAVDIVFKALPDQEKRAKEHLPLLRTVAVKALSSYTVESAAAMTVEQFAAELNKAYTASYGAEHREPPFAEALILKVADAYQRETDWHLQVPSIAQEVAV